MKNAARRRSHATVDAPARRRGDFDPFRVPRSRAKKNTSRLREHKAEPEKGCAGAGARTNTSQIRKEETRAQLQRACATRIQFTK